MGVQVLLGAPTSYARPSLPLGRASEARSLSLECRRAEEDALRSLAEGKAQLAAAAAGSEASLAAMRNDLAAARETAQQARRDFERARQNYNAKILSEAEYQKARSALDTAQANLAATEERMRQAGALWPEAATRCRRRPSPLRSTVS